MSIEVQPVTAERWADLLTLFGERGASAGCWCMWFRSRPHGPDDRRIENRAAMHGLVMDDRVPGRRRDPISSASSA